MTLPLQPTLPDVAIVGVYVVGLYFSLGKEGVLGEWGVEAVPVMPKIRQEKPPSMNHVRSMEERAGRSSEGNTDKRVA